MLFPKAERTVPHSKSEFGMYVCIYACMWKMDNKK